MLGSESKQPVSKESCIYGRRWNSIHDGYFSDSKVAFPLVEAVRRAANKYRPEVVADFGGGTGFVLKELLKHKEFSNVRLVNVDSSCLQLSECSDNRIVFLEGSVDKVDRSQLVANGKGLLIVARSLLHYFGDSGLMPFLGHVRSQLKKGEVFVHQSACFENAEDAECLNHVYGRMGTQKWYTSVDNLKAALNESGFSVVNVCPAAKIRLDSSDLAERYQLDVKKKQLIQKELEQCYSQKPEVFTSSNGSFTVWLHYYIFTCKAT